jgi:rod shape determining protein RodA
MMLDWRRIFSLQIDWVMLLATLPIVVAGMLTMDSFTADNYFLQRQIIWFVISLIAFFSASLIDWRFLRQSGVVASLYGVGVVLLMITFMFAEATRGSKSWLSVFGLTLEPSDFTALIIIIILAKYFTRRHIEIAHIRHILVSGVYAFIPFVLIFIQPNFGSAMVIFFIWLAMIMVSGVSKKHLLLVFSVGLIVFASLWLFAFKPYQKARILSFINPMADIRGAGYNAFQSMIAVGSGGWFGKGVGYGTQSRLKFLPEYQTDFIFASFAEEWGYVGVLILFFLFGVIIWRILHNATLGASNFETLFGVGVVSLLMINFTIHVGMNIGVMPVTGLPMPFMSYGGSHLLNEYLMLGIINGMRKYNLAYHRDDMHNEFVGPQ